MNTNKRLLLIAGLVIGVTALLAVWHLTTRVSVPEGSFLIQYQGKDSYVQMEKLTMAEVSGSIINGKGETVEISQPGILVSDVLAAAGVDSQAVQNVEALADDEYSAQLTGDEIREPAKVYLAKEEDGSMKLIVFGDSNMKRNVRNIVKLVVS
jgi:hypothetical protein